MSADLADWRMKVEAIVKMMDDEYEATRPKTRDPTRSVLKDG